MGSPIVNQKVLGIIPARYASTRLPGKPLILLDGKTMIQRVWERVKCAIEDVVIATDDERIIKVVKEFGGMVIETKPEHPSGTDRCAEAAERYNAEAGQPAEIILNIQGDEPFLQPEQIHELIRLFKHPETDVATLIRQCEDQGELSDPNLPKVVVDLNFRALYFSRSIIPYNRHQELEKWPESGTYYKHIGMYGFRAGVLKAISRLEKTPLEISESLEQLRWLEHGYTIQTCESGYDSISIDTDQDLLNARKKGLVQSFSLPR